jgi:hypothetical protein
VTYRLVVHNDSEHSFEYVIDLFAAELGIPEADALDLALAIHDNGRATLRELDDLAAVRVLEEKLLSGGPDPRMERSRSSLIVSVEEVHGDSVKVVSLGRVGSKGFERVDLAAWARCREEARTRAASAIAVAQAEPPFAHDRPSEGHKLIFFGMMGTIALLLAWLIFLTR